MRQLVLFALLFTATAAKAEETQSLVHEQEGNVRMEVVNTPRGYELQLGGVPPETHAEAFSTQHPSRLIVDVTIQVAQQFRQIFISHPELYSLRYGMRKGKLRLIFDLKSDISPQFQILPGAAGKEVRIRFATKNFTPDVLDRAKKAPKIEQKTAREEAAPSSLTELPLPMRESPSASSAPLVPKRSATNERVLLPLPLNAPSKWSTSEPRPYANDTPSPLIAAILGISAILLATALGLHRKKYGSRSNRPLRVNPFSDLDYCYSVLGVSPDASASDLKANYRRLAKRYHSDRIVGAGGNIVQIRSAESDFHNLQQAYERIKAARGIK